MSGIWCSRASRFQERTSCFARQYHSMNHQLRATTLSQCVSKQCFRHPRPVLQLLDTGKVDFSLLHLLNRHCALYSHGCNVMRNCLRKSSERNYATQQNLVIPNFMRAKSYGDKLAIECQNGQHSYAELSFFSSQLAKTIEQFMSARNHGLSSDGSFVSGNEITDGDFEAKSKSRFSLDGERVAFLCANDVSYTVIQWAIWKCGGVAVPLCKSHPQSELEYFVSDSGACLIVSTEEFQDKMDPVSTSLQVPLQVLSKADYCGLSKSHESGIMKEEEAHSGDNELQGVLEADAFRDRNCMIVYTSGTTGRPKGVVHTFGSINAQITGMVQAWDWTEQDVVLQVLPLHHVHGIVNVLATSLYCGATCVMMDKFDPDKTWEWLVDPLREPEINLFMAVPTIYAKLIENYRGKDVSAESPHSLLRNTLMRKVRLMVSGSAALPQPIMEKWEMLTGHTLLERYGMTEIGMALTNPLKGHRTPGAVGRPFPGVSVQIVSYHDNGHGYDVIVTADCDNTDEMPGMEGNSGELLVKGDNVFKEYWNKPEATINSFTENGWFKTGDTAVYVDGIFRIVGRTSVDVIKTGGYKVSALDIERHLLAHPYIQDVAVIGLPDDTWGQVIAAVIVTRGSEPLTLKSLKGWSADVMPSYQIPRVLKCLPEMPRNAMGKVNKKLLAKDEFPKYFQK